MRLPNSPISWTETAPVDLGTARALESSYAGLAAQLRPYQLEGFRWLAYLWSAGLGGILADDMGLGKTITLIALHLHRLEAGLSGGGPTLVVMPFAALGEPSAARTYADGLTEEVLSQFHKIKEVAVKGIPHKLKGEIISSVQDYWGVEKIVCYDPAYSPYSALPEGRFDGVICVDVPAEEDPELGPALRAAGVDLIRLATPTTDARRLPAVLDGSSGFLYYVSVAGITGKQQAQMESIEANVARIKRSTDLPVAVGFGIRTPERAAEVARVADACVVGSALVDAVADAVAKNRDPVSKVLESVESLAKSVRSARVEGSIQA